MWSWRWRNALLLQHLFAVKWNWLFMIPTVLELRTAAGAPASAELSCGIRSSGTNEQGASQMFSCCSEINNNRLVFLFLKSNNTILAKAV